MKPTILLATALVILAGCSQPAALPAERQEARVQLVQFAQTPGDPQGAEAVSYGTSWDADVTREAVPTGAEPADYGANQKGERWEDGIIQAKSYHLEGVVTTHTHGIVVYADEIIVDGRMNVRDLGANGDSPGYAGTRAAIMSLMHGYGETDQETGEPRLWGHGSTPTDPCESPGGGYIVLSAPTITLNGDLDAGSRCGQAGIVILEGTVTGTGTITASLIIHRGAA